MMAFKQQLHGVSGTGEMRPSSSVEGEPLNSRVTVTLVFCHILYHIRFRFGRARLYLLSTYGMSILLDFIILTDS